MVFEGAKPRDRSRCSFRLFDFLNQLLLPTRAIRLDLIIRSENTELSSLPMHLRDSIINCWTKLDEYFSKVNEPTSHQSLLHLR
jgi:hypothetical protein